MRDRAITLQVKSRQPGGKTISVPICGPLLVILANLGPKDAGPVFTYEGKPVLSWRTAWKSARKRAGLPSIRWHDLRHTAASWMVQEGVPLDVVQEILGHEDIATTKRYAHRDVSAKRAAVDALASRLGHVPEATPIQVAGRKRKKA
jgi:integrase